MFIKSLLKRNFRKDSHAQKLEFGCGDRKLKPGFVGVDIRQFPNVKYVCNAWEIGDYVAPNTVEAIYSRHFFEHLTFPQADLTLNAWKQILIPGGCIQMIVPDMEYHIQQFLNPNPAELSETNSNWTVLQHAVAGFWGWQREGETKMWDVHKSGYDFRFLKMKLLEHNFLNIERLDDKPWNLNVECQKP